VGRPLEQERHDERRWSDEVFANLYLHVSPRRVDATLPATATEPAARRLLDRRLALDEVTPEEYATVRAALET